MGERSRSTGIVPFVDAVGWGCLASAANGHICGHGRGKGRLGRWEVDPAGVRDAAAAEG